MTKLELIVFDVFAKQFPDYMYEETITPKRLVFSPADPFLCYIEDDLMATIDGSMVAEEEVQTLVQLAAIVSTGESVTMVEISTIPHPKSKATKGELVYQKSFLNNYGVSEAIHIVRALRDLFKNAPWKERYV